MFCARQTCRVALVLALLALSPAGAAAQEGPAEGEREATARQVRQVVERLQQVRSERRAAVESHQSRVAALEQQIEQLEGQLRPLLADVAADQSRIAELEARIAVHRQQGDAAAAWIAEVGAAARPVAQAASRRLVHTGDSGRLRSTLREASESLQSADATAQAEGLQMLLSFAGEQWPVLRSVSLANQPLLFRGGAQMEHAWVLRIGSAAQVFVSEDGQTVGVWTGRPKESWTTDVPEPVRRQIVELVERVRGNRPPALGGVPIRISAESEGAPQ